MNNNSNNNLPTVGAQTAMNQDTTECVSIVKCPVEESRHRRLYPLVLIIPDNCDQDQNNGFIPWHLPSGHLPLSGIRIRTMGTFLSDGAGYQLALDPLTLTSDGSSCPGISTNSLWWHRCFSIITWLSRVLAATSDVAGYRLVYGPSLCHLNLIAQPVRGFCLSTV